MKTRRKVDTSRLLRELESLRLDYSPSFRGQRNTLRRAIKCIEANARAALPSEMPPLTPFTLKQNLENMWVNKEKFVAGLGQEKYDAAIRELEAALEGEKK